jgi:tetratricopeptide (TPR) repeat protein
MSFGSQFLKAGAMVLAIAFSTPALAVSGGGGGSGGSSGSAPIVCGEGFVYDEEKKICVPKEALNDEQLYEQGNALALAGHYESALDVLGAIRNKNDAMVLTMMGYSKRKLGLIDEGLALYHQALAIEPDNLNTHEYLGEGYVAIGRVDDARIQLAKLESLCGTDCEQYRELAEAIAGGPAE